MFRNSRRAAVLAAATALTLSLAACGSDNNGSDDGEDTETSQNDDGQDEPDDTDDDSDGETDDDAGDDPDDGDGADGTGNGGGDTEGEDTAALEQAVRDYTDAMFAPDAEVAYETLSDRCQETIPFELFTLMTDSASEEHGPLTVETFEVGSLDGDSGYVNYTVGVSEMDVHEQSWIRENDEWRWDEC